MGCKKRGSNYERKKKELISVNRWKSNFLNIWKEYGTFQEVDGVHCLALYRIDGNGEGQKRMSKHLKQPDLWEKTQNDEISSVSLYFNLAKLVGINDENIQLWVDDMKASLDDSLFYRLKYEISDRDVQSHGFYRRGEILEEAVYEDGEMVQEAVYADDVRVDDVYYDNLSSYIAEKKLFTLDNDYLFDGTYSYDEEVNAEDIGAEIELLPTYKESDDIGVYVSDVILDIDEVDDAVRSFLSEKGVGSDILDSFVEKHALHTVVSPETGGRTYFLPVSAAMGMNGNVFIELVTKTLDFRIRKKGGFWRILKRLAKLFLAAVAAWFQQYWLAASLITGFVADVSDIKILKIASQVLGLLEGDISSLSSIGVGEAISLLINVYSVYIELQYHPETGKEEKEEETNSQKLFYQAPYDAYDDLYCYDDLITVHTGMR